MKITRYITLLLLALFLQSCAKNDLPNLPQISLITIQPITKRTNDTLLIEFSFTDGNASIAYGPNPGPGDTVSRIYIKDSRFPAQGFLTDTFPSIDLSIENPRNGIQGTCNFFPVPQPLRRTDTVHSKGDTLTYEFYITDRSGDSSNHITTQKIYLLP